MRRLTVAVVRDAIEATGLKLKPGLAYRPEEKCGCPIGVVAVAEKGFDYYEGLEHPCITNHMAGDIGLDAIYARAFAFGYDHPDVLYHSANFEGIAGYEDGQLIRGVLGSRIP